MQGFEKIIELLITVVLLFLMPLQYTGAKADVLNRSYVMTETAYLVDAVRATGRLTPQMYQEYVKRLGATGQVYDIELTHYEKLWNETKEGYKVYYQGVYTEAILAQLFLADGERKAYDFLPGDFFRIQVNGIGSSMADRYSLLLRGGEKEKKTEVQAVYGGRIRNEAG